eukprot:GEMP01069496.1.p1 GENE.GEMP01069496.1~~GEMP01069496.1.p1  ORF type:complete len:234 (+),score=36.03 GEMP01069496.1:24-725(+)
MCCARNLRLAAATARKVYDAPACGRESHRTRRGVRPYSQWCREMEVDSDPFFQSLTTRSSSTLVMIDRVKYPANCGAIMRQLPILGADGLFLCHSGGRQYSQRWIKDALRISMVYTREGPRPPLVANVDTLVAVDRLLNLDFAIYSMENIEVHQASGFPSSSIWETRFPSRTCFILGGEDCGIDDSILRRTQGLYIPSCAPHVGGSRDTLNVCIAAALALAERRRQLAHKPLT